ncbi:MAG: DUF2169 domain-containing protein [Gammaproteobacteria bacterium]|nr:DUF2169 domain-containing protein [Gammaproteobacteria bacterium]
MLQLNNKTPFAASIALFPNQQGVDTLYVMVRSSFNIGPQWTLLDEQMPPVEADVYWDEPKNSSLKLASDYHIGKPSTDVVMTGLACAPGREIVKQLDVSLAVGRVSKMVRVYGDRQWVDGRVNDPVPFETMPLVYERAFGGQYINKGRVESVEERNPVGCGYAGGRSVKEMNGVPLPNLEDPAQLIGDPANEPPPACFGYCSPAWQPRADYVGTYDQMWQTQRAPYLPDDFDSRFFNMAHPDLIYPEYMQGGESVYISGMHPNGELRFDLPRLQLSSGFKVGNRVDSESFKLETLHIEPNLLQLSMGWRAAYPCDKKALRIEEITVSLKH